MKNIEIDEELYQYIATNTQFIGESASAILRRLLNLGVEAKLETVTVNELSDVVEVNILPESEEKAVTIETAEVKEPKSKAVVKVTAESHETVFNFINKEELAMQRGAVGRFLLILAALYRAHPEQFGVVTDISGRDRLYFANSENKLAESGSSTKPRQIPESPFWVITNSNTTRKKMMLTKASISLGYSDSDVEKIRELL
ncbi:replication initiation negative regulator SeqA [Colwellia sp. Bg11-28]|uniref:replication initiation negative regulator SeqA n=1 Tax=Colwellia sp. Bg11-28 TaxID=2058305 RepID=UPI000C33EB20|nr:replication initiation negative regulator SeqA [Colwellia sp. Bg11-28]PKH88804.1 replication initiation negative regulator SeqA [Colwellia sp. Bg11-28]